MDIETTLNWLTAIAVASGIGFVVLLALAHRPCRTRREDEGTRF